MIVEQKNLDKELFNDVEYTQHDAVIFPETISFANFALLNMVYNFSHRNAIIVGSNQLIYEQAKNKKDEKDWVRFRSEYEKNKNDIEYLLDKNIKPNTVTIVEEDLPYPVFSLMNNTSYEKFILDTYPQIAEFGKRIEQAFPEHHKIDNKMFFDTMYQIYRNIFIVSAETKGKTQIIYLPLNTQEFNDWINTLDYLDNELDKKMFTQQYSYIEGTILSNWSVMFQTAIIQTIPSKENPKAKTFYYDLAMTNMGFEEGLETESEESEDVEPELFPIIRQHLTDNYNSILQSFGYLYPETINSEMLDEASFSGLTDTQKSDIWFMALATMNTHLLFRLLEFDNKALYMIIQKRAPEVLAATVQMLYSFNDFNIVLSQSWKQTFSYYEDDWNETPFNTVQLLPDMTTKLRFYPNILLIIENMIKDLDAYNIWLELINIDYIKLN